MECGIRDDGITAQAHQPNVPSLFVGIVRVHNWIIEVLDGPFGIIGKDVNRHPYWQLQNSFPVVLEGHNPVEANTFWPQIILPPYAHKGIAYNPPREPFGSIVWFANWHGKVAAYL